MQQTYKPRFWVAIYSSLSLLIFMSPGIYMFFKAFPPVWNVDWIFGGCLTFIPFSLFAFVLIRYFAATGKALILSNDSDLFYFGDESNEKKYNKKDVTRVLIYQPGVRNIHNFYVYEIYFKDGTKIKFSNVIISEQDVIDSFDTDLIRYSTSNTFFRI